MFKVGDEYRHVKYTKFIIRCVSISPQKWEATTNDQIWEPWKVGVPLTVELIPETWVKLKEHKNTKPEWF